MFGLYILTIICYSLVFEFLKVSIPGTWEYCFDEQSLFLNWVLGIIVRVRNGPMVEGWGLWLRDLGSIPYAGSL